MATSGSYDYSVTAAQVIAAAAEDLMVLDPGESINANDQASMLVRLNFLVKQWMGTADFAPGLKMFLRTFLYLFLQKNQIVYQVGPASGDDNAAASYVTTTLTAATASGAAALTVASITGISANDKLGIQLDSGSIQWTTVSGSPSGSTVTAAAVLTGDAASGNRIFTYTTKAQRVTDVLTAVLRNSSTQDTPLSIIKDITVYEAFPSKTSIGDPISIMVEPLRITTKITLGSSPQDVTKVIRMVALYPAEDYDATTDDISYPQHWFAALEWELAKRCAPMFGKTFSQGMQNNLDNALAIARNVNPNTSTKYFQPGLE